MEKLTSGSPRSKWTVKLLKKNIFLRSNMGNYRAVNVIDDI